ncbi:MAG: hypothetical protein EMLJLAPB_00154 [Candidatus Argoarchaeum ethanivorans]|uniref:Uncharacterized protein n=1 Tax=Candidatus Argoarchaeum ethanivorans TaxID=2608793 RepID=A0A811T9H6_9EURY|nr:MAG: hypothetical protein EMLJLAPB_00154 [Candidatus Argoarchaeum ethanivorans]
MLSNCYEITFLTAEVTENQRGTYSPAIVFSHSLHLLLGSAVKFLGMLSTPYSNKYKSVSQKFLKNDAVLGKSLFVSYLGLSYLI